jgi:hypothetical protein
MTDTQPVEAPATLPRVLSLSEAAERLNMKRSNVAKFLARRGINPAFAKAQGYFWWEADIDRAKREREADRQRMAADAKRRRAAIHGAEHTREPVPPEIARLGATQRRILKDMLRRPVHEQTDSTRLALRRLRERGLVEPIPGTRTHYQLTQVGRAAAGRLT